jgi:hypothetical protein
LLCKMFVEPYAAAADLYSDQTPHTVRKAPKNARLTFH